MKKGVWGIYGEKTISGMWLTDMTKEKAVSFATKHAAREFCDALIGWKTDSFTVHLHGWGWHPRELPANLQTDVVTPAHLRPTSCDSAGEPTREGA